MKNQVKKILEEKGEVFNEDIYFLTHQLMRLAREKQPALKEYLRLDPTNRVQWIVDHYSKATELGIKINK